MACKGSCDVLKNTADDEPIFVLVARDQNGPQGVRDWIDRARELGVLRSKIEEAEECAKAMEFWQLDHGSKVPD